MATEKELLTTGLYVRCICMNVIPLKAVHCPYCKRFNAATTAQHCPMCGQSLVKVVEPVEEPTIPSIPPIS